MRRIASFIAGLALLAGVAATVSGGATQARTRWLITDLGTLGGRDSSALAINGLGQIVGDSDTGKQDPYGYWEEHAFLWEKGKLTDVGALHCSAPCDSRAIAINERGQIIGESGHAFLWQDGNMRDLGNCDPSAINERGQVVGTARIALGPEHACRWDDGRVTYLGTLGGKKSIAVAINEHGAIVGSSRTARRLSHAFLWQNGKMTDLGTLPGLESSVATAINEKGQIVGDSYVSGSGRRAFLWQRGKMADLGVLTGKRYSDALAINERGQVVGESYSQFSGGISYDSHAFLWENGKMRDLGDFVPRAINDRGQVVGERFTRDTSVAVLWQGGKLTDLGVLPGTKHSLAVEVNEHDQIVGWSTTRGGKDRAVLWTLRRGS